jgi:hypothetical protein
MMVTSMVEPVTVTFMVRPVVAAVVVVRVGCSDDDPPLL